MLFSKNIVLKRARQICDYDSLLYSILLVNLNPFSICTEVCNFRILVTSEQFKLCRTLGFTT